MATTQPTRTETVRLRGLDVQVDVHGDGGIPVVLLSGGAAGCTSYFPGIVAGLPDRAVVVHDRLGTGRSPKAPAGPTMASWSEDVVALLDALGIEKAVLVGHSLGGGLAGQVVLDAPERIAGALLLDPTPVNDARVCKEVKRSFTVVAGLSRVPLLGPAVVTGLSKMGAPKNLSPEAEQAIADTLVGDWIADTGRAVAGLVDGADAFAARTAIGEVPVTVVIADRKATHRFRLAQEALALQLRGTVELWPDTRHELHLQQPERVVETVRSLV